MRLFGFCVRCVEVSAIAALWASMAGAQATDASWAKSYATDCGSAMKHPCPPSSNGYENEFMGDARLMPLLKRALPQTEGWWVNGYGGSASVSGLAREFLGVPGGLVVDEDRYVTATGCVPHDCTTHGMLWIDTGSQPATVIFVGEELLAGKGKGESGYHLYLYTSRELATCYAGKRHIEMFSPDFLRNLRRWQAASVSKYDEQKVVLVTTVWPNGRSDDHFWSDFAQATPSPANTPGAKQ